MNRATAVAAGAASGYGVAAFAAIAVLLQNISGSADIGVGVGAVFGAVTLFGTFAATNVTKT
ncbi:hypothetical protein C440_12164 [Haloferax mucosum ATCC BAA-1512]|uniref:Uncharacterized protein n=1 Tax=Haloferax mucosum ATCC BAA-1512 TaxID=662479 RepID=M0IA13_9EURY|nr:hypothetical protein [Haloferax mucosum]ELZ92872.1 hypothetical protein C440_12164 [Haloferax mucosum ATCC BAA-1512]